MSLCCVTRRQPVWGAMDPAILAPLVSGSSATGSAALGAIVGFVAAVWWIRKHESGLWTRRIWIGVTLGLVTGVMLHFANRLPSVPTLIEMFEPWPVAGVLTAALGTLGGVIAKLTGSRYYRSAGDQRGNQ